MHWTNFKIFSGQKKNKKPEKSYEDAILNMLPYVAKNNQANRGLKYANFKKFKSFCT